MLKKATQTATFSPNLQQKRRIFTRLSQGLNSYDFCLSSLKF
ncbi:hypothetical protein BN2497_10893 [Janthinobacterium sp. CG23_2]|nr:hypothetical protein BN2497_10893 [Janthinobacterium sp. CG23_2]CUU31844.1 hypothetical protein BN3177_10893 [Janthinobacterium sp. CG23_2]